jgi:hypothetical protein
VYIGVAVALLVGGRLFSSAGHASGGDPEGAGSAAGEAFQPSASFASPSAPGPLGPSPFASGAGSLAHGPPFKRPPSAQAELGVLTDRGADALSGLIDRAALAAAIKPALCGDAAACDAVRATIADEHSTSLQVLDSGAWSLERLDVDAVARDLTPRERAGLKALPRVVGVRVNTATSPKQLALRTAFAAASALATQVGGLVWDQLLQRVENARGFAAHTVTEPLGSATFRRDRIELAFEPIGQREDGVVRLVATGLARWGAPDVDAEPVPTAAAERTSEIVLGVAAAIANGATESPVSLTLDDLGGARGKAYPADGGFPAPAPIEVDVQSVHPESGDANDFIARVQPASGDGALGYVNLAERFFGAILAASPGDDVLAARQGRAQARLASALLAWSGAKAAGARLVVQLPFAIPGGGAESMWIDVTRFDAKSVTGRILDEPLAATDVHRGDEVTRPRAEVEDLDLRLPKN